jgi:hypothetical protein
MTQNCGVPLSSPWDLVWYAAALCGQSQLVLADVLSCLLGGSIWSRHPSPSVLLATSPFLQVESLLSHSCLMFSGRCMMFSGLCLFLPSCLECADLRLRFFNGGSRIFLWHLGFLFPSHCGGLCGLDTLISCTSLILDISCGPNTLVSYATMLHAALMVPDSCAGGARSLLMVRTGDQPNSLAACPGL